jgi:hypothetical protein
MKTLYQYVYREGRRTYVETAGSLALALRYAREDKFLRRVPLRIVADDGCELYDRAQLRDFTHSDGRYTSGKGGR